MPEVKDIVSGYRTPEARWARFGPYYAMFPVDFAFKVIRRYSKKGDFVIDPFAGRCSSIYAGGVLGRHSLGIEINPVGWLYGTVKLQPAEKDDVVDRLLEIYGKRNYYSRAARKLPLFYRMCYCPEVLKFLLCARRHLEWRQNSVDATLMAIILVYLHGKLGEGLSNQMKKSKSMGIKFSVDWWRKNKLTKPPQINPAEFLHKKIEWRYGKGKPKVFDSNVLFGDSTLELDKVVSRAAKNEIKFSLLFTSPPYCTVTDYHADQWLRLWMLGKHEIPRLNKAKHKGRFNSKEDYYALLDSVFGACTGLMAKKSTIYVRTDRRKYTLNSTKEILKKHFPNHRMRVVDKPFTKRTQTEIHGNTAAESGEVDLILKSR